MSLVGQVGMKIAGRDAGSIGVVVADLDAGFVEFSCAVRSRKCNVAHITFLSKKITVKKGASQKDVVAALAKEGFAVVLPKKKATKKAKGVRATRKRKARDKSKDVVKEKKASSKKTTKKTVKKSTKKAAKK